MVSIVKHKKVELTELFYDLVFVYGMSQSTSLIHHLHHGSIPWTSLSAFAICMIIMINSWMVQTVFTNRFGKNSLTNILFMHAQMVLLLISLTSTRAEFSTETFRYFYGPYAAISFVQWLQYLVEYFQTSDSSDRLFIKQFFYILGLRTVGLLVALLVPSATGLWVAAISILLVWILPGLMTSRQAVGSEIRPVNFPHLVERLSLLVIITFGEMIIGIAKYFTPETLSLSSVLIFTIVANLFMIYIVEIDHLIDVNQTVTKSNRLIYWHYPIFFGLSFITVGLGFLGDAEVSNSLGVLLFYLGFFLLLFSIGQFNAFNKATHRFTGKLIASCLATWVVGLVLSSFFMASSTALILIAAIAVCVVAILAVHFNLSHIPEN